jgi:hypothetical protein
VSSATKPTEVAVPTEREALKNLIKRAASGDTSTLPALRKVLESPAAVDAFGGDLARQAQLTLIAKLSGKDLLFKEALTRKLELLRAELAGPKPSPLERLLVERIVACWLHLSHLEANYAGKDSMSLQLGTYYQRSFDQAQKRYIAAIKALAVVRRLALPVLLAQVNVAANQQVNVGAGGKPGQGAATAQQGGAKEPLPDVRPVPSSGR